ncbi:unnamed protein product [Absidia cylindrospora]
MDLFDMDEIKPDQTTQTTLSEVYEGAIDVLVEALSSAIDLGKRLMNTFSQILDDSNTVADIDANALAQPNTPADDDAPSSLNTLSVTASPSDVSTSLNTPPVSPLLIPPLLLHPIPIPIHQQVPTNILSRQPPIYHYHCKHHLELRLLWMV